VTDTTTTDLTQRLATIRDWAHDAEPALDGPAAAALRSIGHLCDVVAALAARVEALEAQHIDLDDTLYAVDQAIDKAIRVHRNTQHLP
jgi:hypothetical protein